MLETATLKSSEEMMMVRRSMEIFPTEGDRRDEVRVPPECLAEMGIAPGTRVVVEATPGRLLLSTFWDAREVRSDLGAIARDLEEIRGRLRRVAGLLPEPRAAGTAEPTPGTPEISEVGADLLGTLECILADDIEPALVKLQEAVATTLGQLGRFE
jgi:hypothetical protein